MPVLPSYRNESIDLLCKSIDWFLFEGSTGTYWVKHVEYNLCAFKEVPEARKVSLSCSCNSLVSSETFLPRLYVFQPYTYKNSGHSSIAATPSISPTWFIVTDLQVLAFSLP